MFLGLLSVNFILFLAVQGTLDNGFRWRVSLPWLNMFILLYYLPFARFLSIMRRLLSDSPQGKQGKAKSQV